MAKTSRLKVLNSIMQEGLLPLFYNTNADVVVEVIHACLIGGAGCFEFTNRGDCAYDVFRQVTERMKDEPHLVLGAGTIMDSATAALYIQAGAAFIVSPNLNPDVARLCNRRKIAYFPGCGTVSEISQAEELGIEICKVFPGGSVGGPGFVKNVLGPMPWSNLLPTGGVEATEENVSAWIKAGAIAVGIGSSLFKKEIIDNKDYQRITELVKNMLHWIQVARDGKSPLG